MDVYITWTGNTNRFTDNQPARNPREGVLQNLKKERKKELLFDL